MEVIGHGRVQDKSCQTVTTLNGDAGRAQLGMQIHNEFINGQLIDLID